MGENTVLPTTTNILSSSSSISLSMSLSTVSSPHKIFAQFTSVKAREIVWQGSVIAHAHFFSVFPRSNSPICSCVIHSLKINDRCFWTIFSFHIERALQFSEGGGAQARSQGVPRESLSRACRFAALV